MAELTTIPYGAIRLVDVRDTLRANGGVVNNDMASFFSVDAKINKWSWHKPIPHVDENIIPSAWESKAAEVNHGFDVSNTQESVENYRNLCLKASSGELSWPYADDFSPMRLPDFGGYEPSAGNPFALSAFLVRDGGQLVLRLYMNGADLNTMATTWSGLDGFVGCGVALWKGDEHRYYHMGRVSDVTTPYEIPVATLGNGDWSCILCLDTSQHDAAWINEGFNVLAMPVEHVSQGADNELATFTISGGSPTPPSPSGMSVGGEYDCTLTILSDGNVQVDMSNLAFAVENNNNADFESVVRFQASTMRGMIRQDVHMNVSAQSIGLVSLEDFDEDTWSEWILRAGENEPEIFASYTYLGVAYNVELTKNIIHN